MHGNAGNKFEGASYASQILPLGVDLFSFDFSGCGNSDGEWVTLGWKEKSDLTAVLSYLEKTGTTSKVVLWGRSMGAATTLMSKLSETPLPVAGVICDSSFANFEQIASHMVVEKMGLPEQFLQMLWPQITQGIQQVTGGMDLSTLKPVEFAKNQTVPALFVHGVDDELIPMEHTERIFAAYAGTEKNVAYCEGDHNSERDPATLNQVFDFIKAKLL